MYVFLKLGLLGTVCLFLYMRDVQHWSISRQWIIGIGAASLWLILFYCSREATRRYEEKLHNLHGKDQQSFISRG